MESGRNGSIKSKSRVFAGKEKIYNCELEISREDKIAFVDSMQDGKLSYLLNLIDKFIQDEKNMPKNQWGNVKTVSLKAWIKKNDTKYDRPIIDNEFRYGAYSILGERRTITCNVKGSYDTYDDLVDELFHRQLRELEKQERSYFLEHDEYSILKSKLREYLDKYSVSFGVNISTCSDGEIYIYSGKDYDDTRKITIEEINELLSKYKQLDSFVDKLTTETHIVFRIKR